MLFCIVITPQFGMRSTLIFLYFRVITLQNYNIIRNMTEWHFFDSFFTELHCYSPHEQCQFIVLVSNSLKLKKGEIIPGKISSKTSLPSYLLKISEFRTNSLIIHIITTVLEKHQQKMSN